MGSSWHPAGPERPALARRVWGMQARSQSSTPARQGWVCSGTPSRLHPRSWAKHGHCLHRFASRYLVALLPPAPFLGLSSFGCQRLSRAAGSCRTLGSAPFCLESFALGNCSASYRQAMHARSWQVGLGHGTFVAPGTRAAHARSVSTRMFSASSTVAGCVPAAHLLTSHTCSPHCWGCQVVQG